MACPACALPNRALDFAQISALPLAG